MKHRVMIAAIAALAASSSPALANGTLCGTVREHGRPLAGATVTIDSASERNSVQTNAKGLYCFGGLHANTHAVRVEKNGYQTVISRGFLPVSQVALRLNFDTLPGKGTLVRTPLPAPNANADTTASVYIVH